MENDSQEMGKFSPLLDMITFSNPQRTEKEEGRSCGERRRRRRRKKQFNNRKKRDMLMAMNSQQHI